MSKSSSQSAPTCPIESANAEAPTNASRAELADRIILWLAAVAILSAAVWEIYGRGIGFPLVFDDTSSIINNRSIVRLWPPVGDWEHPGPLNPPSGLSTAGRPLVNLSLAINYQFGQLNPAGYHVFNLIIHLLSALLLMAIVQRTLCLDYFEGRFARASAPLGFTVALLWAVHPLQTETVIYVTQRTELMVGFFYLATLYISLRYWAATSAASRKTWVALATLACLAGVASKEVMVTAPVVVLLFDRTFIAGSFRRALEKSWPLYVGLFCSWGLLCYLNCGAPRSDSAGFHLGAPVGVWWLTQTKVLLLYLKLAVWPWPLAIHYDIPYLTSVAGAWPWLVPSAILGIVTLVLLWRRSASGFVGAWVFIVLSPTLVVPIITEVAAERRMYLPLAALTALVVVVVYWLAAEASRRWPQALAIAGALMLAVVLCFVSIERLQAYHDGLTLWQDNVLYQPDDAVAQNNLGRELHDVGRSEEAISHFEKALGKNPNSAEIQYNLANALSSIGRPVEAIDHYQMALRLKPTYAEVDNNLAWLLATTPNEKLRDPQRAVELAKMAIELNPALAGTMNTLGVAEYRAGMWQDAIECLDKSTKAATGGNSYDWFYLAMAHKRLGQRDEAQACYDKAVAWMQQHAPEDKELLRLQSEAEELLGHKSTSDRQPR